MRCNDYFEWNGRLRDIWRLQVAMLEEDGGDRHGC